MKKTVEGVAEIQLSNGQIVHLQPDEIDFEDVGGDEGGMGLRSTYEAIYEHDNGDTVTWTLSEYPVGAEEFKETSASNGVKVLQDFTYYLEHEKED